MRESPIAYLEASEYRFNFLAKLGRAKIKTEHNKYCRFSKA